jgi:hypothetical protein
MQQVRELRRDVSEIRAGQAAQPTRADLQAYVLREVFDLKIKELESVDRDQEERIEAHENHLQTSLQRTLQNAGITVGILSGLFALIHGFLH